MINRSRYVITKQHTVSNTAMSLVDFGFSATTDVPMADRVIISVTAGALRINWDTTLNVPTTSTGLKIPTNDYPLFVLEGRFNAANLRMIRDSSSDATVDITIESD